MNLPDWHIHVSEREPDGTWEDCSWDSAIEWARLTWDRAIPATHAEAQALRADSGDTMTGGSNVGLDVPKGLLKRYGLVAVPRFGFANLWPNLPPGTAAVATGMMGAFPDGHTLRRWDKGFTGAHAVVVMRLDTTDRVWWCDPLAPAGTYNGEWVSKADLQRFVNLLSGAPSLARPILEEAMRPLVISDKTPLTISVAVGAQLYLPDLTPKVTASNVNGAYSPFECTLGTVKYRALYVTTAGVFQMLLVKASDITKQSAVAAGDCTAQVKAALDAHIAEDAAKATAHAAEDAKNIAEASATAKALGISEEKSRLRRFLGL